MENEYRERTEGNRGDSGAGKKERKSRREPDPREILENLKGNVYVERDEVKEGVDKSTARVKAAAAEAKRASGGNTKEKAASSKKGKGTARRANLLVQVLNGDILTRDFVLNNLTFIFFILFLLLLVVGKGYYGKQLTKDIDTLQTEVNASTAEYIENKAKLEELTTRYRLVEALEHRGLKETVKPAKVIRLKPEGK